jgi:hypothetical protein
MKGKKMIKANRDFQNKNGLVTEEIPATNIGLVGRKFATIFGKAECV